MRAGLVGAAAASLSIAAVIVVPTAPVLVAWFQSWSGYRCRAPLDGGAPACEHHVEQGPAGLVVFAAAAVTIFLPCALVVLRGTKVDRS